MNVIITFRRMDASEAIKKHAAAAATTAQSAAASQPGAAERPCAFALRVAFATLINQSFREGEHRR